jgi:hypothetical protein
MHILQIVCLLMTLLAGILWAVHLWRDRCNVLFVDALQAGDLNKARILLDGYHDWDEIIHKIELRRDPRLWQAALSVHFKYRNIPDENYGYPEDVDVIMALIKKGARPTFQHLQAATEQGKMKTARVLLDYKVPVSDPNDFNDTPLANAAYYGDCQLIEKLLSRGADVNRGASNGWRPILAAAWSYHEKAVALLLQHGANPTLDYTEYKGHTVPIWMTIRDRAKFSQSAASWHLIEVYLKDRGISTIGNQSTTNTVSRGNP